MQISNENYESKTPRRTGVSPVYCREQGKQDDYTDIPNVGQASRLSTKSWERHLPHFQISAGYYFITIVTHNRKSLLPFQKDYIFNALRFLDDKKYNLYAAVVLNDHAHVIINPIDTLSILSSCQNLPLLFNALFIS